MLKSVLSYKEVFTHWIHSKLGPDSLMKDGWTIVQIFYTFLKSFHENIVSLSVVYTPTSYTALFSLLDIAMCLSQYKTIPLLKLVIEKMQNKFWKDLTYLYCFTVILDLRWKILSLHGILLLMVNIWTLTMFILPSWRYKKVLMSFIGHMKMYG